MGCDIHLHIEIKIAGIEGWQHFSHPHVHQNYLLFSYMANVRNYDNVTPISSPKGLPPDISEVTKYCYTVDKLHYHPHSESYLDSDEIAKLDEVWESFAKEDFNNDLEHSIFQCYLFGNSFGGFRRYGDKVPNLQDVRFVFWFDN